jgi:hypothetical protein
MSVVDSTNRPQPVDRSLVVEPTCKRIPRIGGNHAERTAPKQNRSLLEKSFLRLDRMNDQPHHRCQTGTTESGRTGA